MRKSLLVVYATVVLDAAGIGLALPVFPGLLREVGHTDDLGWRFGAFLALYALMQFVCAPILGAFSDGHGRRPIMMLSLAGAGIDYLFMALAPSLWLLFVGRAIAGITGASMAVASAAVTDLTEEQERTRRFAQMSACFGIGFIAGPAIGGMLGEISVRLPFVAAAGLNAANLLLAWLLLPETRRPGEHAEGHGLSPLAHFRWLAGAAALVPLVAIYFILAIVGEVGGTVWVLYGTDKFHWSPVLTGISLAAFGFFHAVTQAFIAGPIGERWGERRTVLIGVLSDSVAYVAIALVTDGRMAFALMPLFCLGGIGAPAVQSMLAAQVDSDSQGRLQGVLASTASLATIVGPLLISTVYFSSRQTFPGLVWMLGAALYLVCLPLLARREMPRPS